MSRRGRKRAANRRRHPGGKLIQPRRAEKRGEVALEVQLQRAAHCGRLPPANRALWLAGRVKEAVRGTDVRSRSKKMHGPDVPKLRTLDSEQAIDAPGRAWLAGLLDGYGVESDRLRDSARDIAALYWRHLRPRQEGAISSLYRNMVSRLRDEAMVAGSTPLIEDDVKVRDERQEAALLRILREIDAQGQDARSAFDGLVIDPNPDHGPAWLDRLLTGAATPFDQRRLDIAVECLLLVAR